MPVLTLDGDVLTLDGDVLTLDDETRVALAHGLSYPPAVGEAAEAIAELDAALAEIGEDIMLRRLTLGPNGQQIPFAVTCRARVRNYTPDQLVGGLVQGDSQIIMGPSEIIRAQWPGAGPSGAGDKRVPKKGDQLIVQGRPRAVQTGIPFYLAGALVRIELLVRG